MSPVLCILGAGKNVGVSVARQFASKGYQVALVSRTKKEENLIEGSLHFKGDFSDPSSVREAFAEIRKSLGIPSVVVYNAASHTPNDKADPFSLPPSTLSKDFSVNTIAALVAADEAVKRFRELPSEVFKTFIFTGNRLNIAPLPGILSMGMGKAATAHLIATASFTYKNEGFSFYYADERTADGAPVYGAIDGEAHGDFYWQLAAREAEVPWLATFVKGIGYTDFSKTPSKV